MAHFAKLDENNIVQEVIVVNNDVITVNGVESEQAGIDFLIEIFGHRNWKQTSYNGSFRKHYAGPGFYYDLSSDSFIPPKPYSTWKLNYETYEWEPPIPAPQNEEGYKWKWSEFNQEWIKVAISV